MHNLIFMIFRYHNLSPQKDVINLLIDMKYYKLTYTLFDVICYK